MKTKNLLLGIAIGIGTSFATVAQNVPNYVPTNGLVGWWPFNGNANDESGNNNNGTVNSATLTIDRNGNLGKAYSFDGVDDYIEIQNNSSLNPTSITICGWINNGLDATNNSTSAKGIVTKWFQQNNCLGNSDNYTLLLSYVNNNSLLIGATLINSQSTNALNSINNVIGTNSWKFFTFIHDESIGQKLFIDGVLINSNNTSGSLCFTTNKLIFGADNQFGIIWRHFTGILDDIGIWNRALTQQEITDLYNAVNCNLNISPQNNTLQIGNTAIFNATTSDPNPNYIWQSDLGQGFQTLNNYGIYSGVNTSTLNIANVQLANHNQPIRAISTSGNCVDTSNIAYINIVDTCITTTNETIYDTTFVTVTDTNYVTVYDTVTTYISVTDTLFINVNTVGLNNNTNINTIKVFPNPANSHLNLDFGNFNSLNGYSIKIYNSLSQVIYNQQITQQSETIDLSTFGGNGVYFLHVINAQNNTVEIRKIVLQ